MALQRGSRPEAADAADQLVVDSRRGWRSRLFEGVVTLITAGVGAYLAIAIATSPNINWGSVGRYMYDSRVLDGVTVTLELAGYSCLLATALGTLLGVMRLSRTRIFRGIATSYVWFFRGTPLLVQIVFWFNIALIFPRIHLFGIDEDTNKVITQFAAGVIGLSTNAAAYVSEVVRGGILSVDRGQGDAAAVIGLTPRQAMYRVILPQAVRVMVPPYGNIVIDLLKATALVSVIGTQDLLTSAQSISQQNYQVVDLLCVVALWFLILVTALTFIQGRIEKRLARVTGTATGRSLKRKLSPFGLLSGNAIGDSHGH